MKNLKMILVIFLILVGGMIVPLWAEEAETFTDIDLTPLKIYGTADNDLPIGEVFYAWDRSQTEELYRIINDSVPIEDYNNRISEIENVQTEIITQRIQISFWKGMSSGLGIATAAETILLVCIIFFGG